MSPLSQFVLRKFAIIVSRFNSFVTERLLSGALDALTRTGAATEDIEIVRVPGSWEMPVTAAELARQKRHDGIICLSAVIRGDTPHFDHIAAEASKGLAQTSLETGIPIAFGVLTTNTLEQAIARVNSTPYGLATGIFTNRLGDAFAAAHKLEVGGVHVNVFHVTPSSLTLTSPKSAATLFGLPPA